MPKEVKKIFDIGKPVAKPVKPAVAPKSIDNIALKAKVSAKRSPVMPTANTIPGDTPIIVRREGTKVQPLTEAPAEKPASAVKPVTYKSTAEETVPTVKPLVEEQETPDAEAVPTPGKPAEIPAPGVEEAESADTTETTLSAETPAQSVGDESTAEVETGAEEAEPAPAAGAPDESKLNEHKAKDQAALAEMQRPKVYDTKEYYLPIAGHKTHSHSKTMVVVLLLLVLLVAGFVLAVDAELIDVGFDLPFDLL